MPTREDCVALCGLNEAEINAIAQHERVPEMAALELGAYLCRAPEGKPAIRRMILDDIEATRRKGDSGAFSFRSERSSISWSPIRRAAPPAALDVDQGGTARLRR